MKFIMTVFLAVATIVLTGCFTGTTTTITEFDTKGNVVKVTETGESVVKSVVESTKDKTCITWESGWAAYLTATAASTEDPTPTLKIGAGKVDKGVITLHPNHTELQKIIPDVIKSTRQDLTVSTDGVSTVEK